MRANYQFLILGVCSLMILRCAKPYEAESFDFERVVVVDGQISDELKKHRVILSHTTPIGESKADPLSGAEVWVEEGSGTKIEFQEIRAGYYETVEDFAGKVGSSYRLFFVTLDGKEYASNNIELIKSPPIDSIYDQFARLITEDETGMVGGIQFFIDTHDATNTAKYFRYEWEEDYRILSPLPSNYEFFSEDSSYAARESPVSICYDHRASSQIIVGSSIGSTVNRLVQFPIRFVPGNTDVLRNRYAILVKQYAISESAYGFYRKLKESSESGGSLFDKQQGTITGNVTSVSNSKETVLGFFEVAGVSTKRTFFSYEDLDPRFNRPDFRYDCTNQNIFESSIDSMAFYVLGNGYLVISVSEMAIPEVLMTTPTCGACNWYATTEKPDFWID
jgi:hypothetical protein